MCFGLVSKILAKDRDPPFNEPNSIRSFFSSQARRTGFAFDETDAGQCIPVLILILPTVAPVEINYILIHAFFSYLYSGAGPNSRRLRRTCINNTRKVNLYVNGILKLDIDRSHILFGCIYPSVRGLFQYM